MPLAPGPWLAAASQAGPASIAELRLSAAARLGAHHRCTLACDQRGLGSVDGVIVSYFTLRYISSSLMITDMSLASHWHWQSLSSRWYQT